MNFYRRNTFHDWFVDVGYIYLLVISLVTLVYFFQIAELPMPTFLENSASPNLSELPLTP